MRGRRADGTSDAALVSLILGRSARPSSARAGVPRPRTCGERNNRHLRHMAACGLILVGTKAECADPRPILAKSNRRPRRPMTSHEINRRIFLKRTGLAAGLAGAG